MKPASPGGQYTVPPEPSRMPAILLAVAVHVLLLAFLYFGISWQSKTPISVEAEVWDMKVETAAAPPLPAPPVETEPEPEPEPEPAPTPPPAPKVVEPEPVKPSAPDIALEREKQRKIELAKQERREQEQREQRERDLAEKKEREELKKKELAEEKRREELKEREEQKKRELAEKKKEDDKKKKDDEKKLAAEKAAADKKKLADEKAAKAKADAAVQAKLDKLRDLEIKRMTGAAGSTGTAQKSSGPKLDAGYQAAIAAKVKSNTVYTGGDEPGNPTVEFRIEQLPTGEILSARKTKSSGIPAFDEAVERGIIKSSPLPKKKDGTVERTFPLSFKLKDLQ